MFGLYLVNNVNLIKDNTFVNDGITFTKLNLDQLLEPEIINNTVNGRPLLCYKNSKNFKISDASQIILSNCINGEISNVKLNNTDTGIYVLSSSKISVTNCNISNNLVGISEKYSNDVAISRNDIFNNSWSGIWFYKSDENLIKENIFVDNNYGLFFYSSGRSNIKNNSINKNLIGISFWESSITNKIKENNLINNSQNAFDECKNHWNKNYWSDWVGLNQSFLKWKPYKIPGRLFLNLDWNPAHEPYYN
jgi:nitrous oxidase accessory protein